MNKKCRTVMLAPEQQVERVFGNELLKQIKEMSSLIADYLPSDDEETVKTLVSDAEAIISTWGMPNMTKAVLDSAPKLKIIIYAASSVKYFITDEVFKRSITVTSAAPVNGRIVAEYTLSVITLCLKNAWGFIRREEDITAYFKRERKWQGRGGYYNSVIGIIGASAVGEELIRMLSGYPCTVLVYDPYLTPQDAKALGAEKSNLKEIMSSSDIVSLHAPNLPELRNMIDKSFISSMKDGAWFINTARGELVDEDALISELKTGRINACIDVTHPEPPREGSPLYNLPNVVLTPHMAGAIGADCRRLGETAIEELRRYLDGEDPLYPIIPDKLSIIS